MKQSEIISYLFTDARARVYLSWAIICGVGFTATHYYQNKGINLLWVILSAIGLYIMYNQMPMRVKQMRNILAGWATVILLGIVASIVMFYIPSLQAQTRNLGIFWLIVMAIGYLVNALTDSEPVIWYYVAFGLNLAAAGLCVLNNSAGQGQYLIAAIVSVWSMSNLWLLRTWE